MTQLVSVSLYHPLRVPHLYLPLSRVARGSVLWMGWKRSEPFGSMLQEAQAEDEPPRP